MVQKTGYFLRVEREGKWLSLDVAELTDDELREVFVEDDQAFDRQRLAHWVVILAGWIRDRAPSRDEVERVDAALSHLLALSGAANTLLSEIEDDPEGQFSTLREASDAYEAWISPLGRRSGSKQEQSRVRCPAQNPLTGIREAIALLSQAYDQAQREPKGRLVAAETLDAAAGILVETAARLRCFACDRDGQPAPRPACRCGSCRGSRKWIRQDFFAPYTKPLEKARDAILRRPVLVNPKKKRKP